MQLRSLALMCGALGLTTAVFAEEYRDRIPEGTQIEVRTDQSIRVKDKNDGRVYTATVSRDVFDQDGKLAIPRGAQAELVVRDIGNHEIALDMDALVVHDHRYLIDAQGDTTANAKDGVGKNKRTAKFLGGGAVVGSIIGAIAGGGKGAAIGAAAGAAAGAGAQTVTRGRSVDVPVESLLTFRLERPLYLRDHDRR